VKSRRTYRLMRNLLVACLAVGLGAAATAAAPGGDDAAGEAVFAPEPPVSTIPAAESASFGILRQAQGPADGFGGSVPSTAAGANPELARSVAVPTSSLSAGRVWVVPADNAICLRVLDPLSGDGWVCATTADAVAGTLIGAMRSAPEDDGPAFVHGLVPDGVAHVTVIGPDGTATGLAVTDNVFSATIPATPASVTYSLADGRNVILDVP
jgi:hypothetical protein